MSCVISLGIEAVVFGLFCAVAVKYVAVPLVFGRGRLPSVVVWSWSMGWARFDAQGAVGVLSGLVVGGVLVVVVLVVWGSVLCLCLPEWGDQGWRRRVIVWLFYLRVVSLVYSVYVCKLLVRSIAG